MKKAVIFGGTGFIGTHLAQFLLSGDPEVQVVLVDIREPRNEKYTKDLQGGLKSGRVEFVNLDVREQIPTALAGENVDVVYNLAAIHREPGHKTEEYFETNLKGAENICAWASRKGCKVMVFTSSISTYGPSEASKNELSTPSPETAYGSSKLVSEKIHIGWQAGDASRRLLILRPGVVFGPGEGGNVTRLVRSLVKGYFAYMGNKRTLKAAIYVKELCRVMEFGLISLKPVGQSVCTLNCSIDPVQSIEQFVEAIRKTANIRRLIVEVPRSFLLGVSYPIAAVTGLVGLKQPINPVRMRKLFRSTNIDPRGLREAGYKFHYSMETAMADWKSDLPEDFR